MWYMDVFVSVCDEPPPFSHEPSIFSHLLPGFGVMLSHLVFQVFWGSKLWSFCLCSKPFTDPSSSLCCFTFRNIKEYTGDL